MKILIGNSLGNEMSLPKKQTPYYWKTIFFYYSSYREKIILNLAEVNTSKVFLSKKSVIAGENNEK